MTPEHGIYGVVHELEARIKELEAEVLDLTTRLAKQHAAKPARKAADA